MVRDSRRMWAILAAGGVVVLLAAVAVLLPRCEEPSSPDEFTTVYVRWQAPTTGAAAVRYLLRIQELEGASEDTLEVAAQAGPAQSFAFTKARPGHEYRACICGVDARGRQGPWSGWSPVYRREPATARP